MIYKRLGDYIRLVNNRNRDLAIKKVYGVNLSKSFMPSIANTSNVNLSVYKIVKKGQFGCKLMSVGRDNRLPIGYLTESDSVIISPAYYVFEVIDSKKIIPEFLMMWFLRNETDRWLGYISAGDVRGGVSWNQFCNMKIPIPNLDEQKKYVDLYNGLINNQNLYKNSFEDLQLICDTYIENLIKKEKPKVLGEYIEQTNIRNSNLKLSLSSVRGVSINKTFIETKANMSNVSLHNYKIVKNRHFAFNPNTSRNGDKLSIAMSNQSELLVSSIYTVFKSINTNQLLPEYLLLFFKRSEFDRYARFHSWGSAREIFNWDDMSKVKLPIPNIHKQEAIVKIYNILEQRKLISNKLNEILKPLCPVLMRGVIENNEIYRR